jgi:hypothetical protein
MRLLHVRTTQHHPMARAEVDGPEHDTFRVPSRNRHMGLLAPQSPGTTQDGKEAEDCFILTEEDGIGWQLPETADYRPFFCARCGAFSS